MSETSPEDEQAPPGAAAEVRRAVASALRRARLSRGASLRELSERTGVSKALLSQLERGVANPTLDVLVRLAEALDLSFAELTRRRDPGPTVVRGGEGPVTDLDGAATRTLFSVAERSRADISEGLLPAHHTGDRNDHGPGSTEHAYVVAGHVVLTVHGTSVELGPGDAVRFAADAPHRYTTGDEGARVLTVITVEDR